MSRNIILDCLEDILDDERIPDPIRGEIDFIIEKTDGRDNLVDLILQFMMVLETNPRVDARVKESVLFQLKSLWQNPDVKKVNEYMNWHLCHIQFYMYKDEYGFAKHVLSNEEDVRFFRSRHRRPIVSLRDDIVIITYTNSDNFRRPNTGDYILIDVADNNGKLMAENWVYFDEVCDYLCRLNLYPLYK